MKYISVEQAAQKWGLNRKTVSDYCKNGVIKCTKLSGRWLIPEGTIKPVLARKKAIIRDFSFVDLFCGIGGFHQAMTALGGKCVFACDINETCRQVYKDNFIKANEFELLDDINKVVLHDNLPLFDVLCGGFPCQTFSKAGKRNGFTVVEAEDGTKDERGQLFFRIIDILRNHQECNYVILENVRNLADNEENWNVVCSELKQLGFIITEDPIIESPHHFGIPQVRDRVYILGVKERAIRSEELGKERKITRAMLGINVHYKACSRNCIPKLLDPVADPKYYVPDELVEVLNIWDEFLENVQDVKSPFWLHKAGLGIYDDEQYKADPIIDYQGMPDWKKELVWKSRVMYNNNYEFIDEWAARYNMTEKSLIHQKFEWNASRSCTTIKQGITQFRQSGIRVKNPDYFPSLVAMNNTPIVWDNVAERYRFISPHEAAKLQSFKKQFKFNESDSVSYRQLGNAVNVKMIRLFAEALLNL
jgi:DNA (cytosine-5)-methyltransferase 1